MYITHTQGRRKGQTILYGLTLLVMVVSGYLHLDFAAHGIAHARLDDLLEAWPIFFLLLSGPLLLIATVVGTSRPRWAAIMALAATVPAGFYCVIVIYALFYSTLIFACVSPPALLSIFLLMTTFYSLWILRTQYAGEERQG